MLQFNFFATMHIRHTAFVIQVFGNRKAIIRESFSSSTFLVFPCSSVKIYLKLFNLCFKFTVKVKIFVPKLKIIHFRVGYMCMVSKQLNSCCICINDFNLDMAFIDSREGCYWSAGGTGYGLINIVVQVELFISRIRQLSLDSNYGKQFFLSHPQPFHLE